MSRYRELLVFVGGVHAGTLVRADDGAVTFRYDDAYRYAEGATPLSLSMPLVRSVHDHQVISAYCENLLPDSTDVRGRWAARFQTRDNAFDLLTHVGEDCAGGVQFVRPERVDQISEGTIEPLSEADIAERIRELRTDPTSWQPELAYGQFSLAGAQSKFALFFDGEAWGRPTGATPTTHIIKPRPHWLLDHEINEYLTLALAAATGITTAPAQLMEFAGERAVVVRRYDRLVAPDGVFRLHQEDCCQALGIPPARKYEDSGGPGVATIIELLKRSDDPVHDIQRFLDAVIFNWIVTNTDAHAKNYSLLLNGNGVRLAPMYDLGASIMYVPDSPFETGPGNITRDGMRSAMRIGPHYAYADITAESWRSLGDAIGIDGIVERGQVMASLVGDVVGGLCEAVPVDSAFPEKYAKRMQQRASFVLHLLNGTVSRPRSRKRR